MVLVTHNSSDVLGPCLESLRDTGADGVDLVEVVVVDNASTDRSAEIARSFDGLPVSVLEQSENVGYAAGLNAGLAHLTSTRPDAVLLLNPDCRVRAGALERLVSALAEPGRGIVAPRLVNPDGSLQPTLRRAPSLAGVLAEAVLGGRVADWLGVGELVFGEGPHDQPGRASWVTGAALLMSWRMLESVGPWDEHFLLYSEETEYMLRAADLGWATWYEPGAVVEHRGGESDVRPDLAALLSANKVDLFVRRNGPVRGLAYRVALLSGQLARAAAGRPTARAAVAALLLPSRRVTSLAQLR